MHYNAEYTSITVQESGESISISVSTVYNSIKLLLIILP